MSPFFLSPPRTRSTVLYELTSNYVKQKYGLLEIKNHSELFLQFNSSVVVTNHRVNQTFPTEMIPLVYDDCIHMHFIYPYMFKNLKERNLHKLDVLRQEKENGRNYHIKGTLQVSETPKEIIEFFGDRHFVITKRRNTLDQLLSLLYAKETRQFTVRQLDNSMRTHAENLSNGVVISDYEEVARAVIKQSQAIYNLESVIHDKGLTCSVVYYEDLNTTEKIFTALSTILDDASWHHSLPNDYENNLVIDMKMDYSKAIVNYEEVKSKLLDLIEEYQFYV